MLFLPQVLLSYTLLLCVSSARNALFCVITQPVVVIPYRCLGTTYTVKDGTQRLSRNVVRIATTRCVMTQKSALIPRPPHAVTSAPCHLETQNLTSGVQITTFMAKEPSNWHSCSPLRLANYCQLSCHSADGQ